MKMTDACYSHFYMHLCTGVTEGNSYKFILMQMDRYSMSVVIVEVVVVVVVIVLGIII